MKSRFFPFLIMLAGLIGCGADYLQSKNANAATQPAATVAVLTTAAKPDPSDPFVDARLAADRANAAADKVERAAAALGTIAGAVGVAPSPVQSYANALAAVAGAVAVAAHSLKKPPPPARTL
jgi:hypothetical protein